MSVTISFVLRNPLFLFLGRLLRIDVNLLVMSPKSFLPGFSVLRETAIDVQISQGLPFRYFPKQQAAFRSMHDRASRSLPAS